MKSSSIAENVFSVNLMYSKLQNQTKELFFKCLDEGQTAEYFERQLRKLWDINDFYYLEELVREYRSYIHTENTGQEYTKREEKEIKTDGIIQLTGAILLTNELFKKSKIKEYETRYESYAYKTDKFEYLKKLVPKYTNNIKPYYEAGQPKTVDNIVRFVSPNTYNSMVYNTCLTRNGWIQTLNDGNEMGIPYYYIPNHSFSCPHCILHQERRMTAEECYNIIGTADEGKTELLHPNCKCELWLYDKNVRFKKLNKTKLAEQYEIREKVMASELKRETLLSDRAIYKRLGSQEDVDKVNNKIKKINENIKDLVQQLPTQQLRKEVVIRNYDAMALITSALPTTYK